jgi:hypothetical protein
MNINVELRDDLTWALPQFLKRVDYNDYRALAVDEQEAYGMVDAGEKVRAALGDQDITPR